MTVLDDDIDLTDGPDEPPTGSALCFMCATRRREHSAREAELLEGIRQAVIDLRCGVSPHIVAVNLDVLEGPFSD